MKLKTLFFTIVLTSNFASQLMAYDPDRRDNTLYDKNQYRKDWYYQDKWRYDREPYLEGENQPLPPPPVNENSQQAVAQGYSNRHHYVRPNQRDQVIHGDDLIPAWDYRDNWRYNRDAYLRGNNRPYHYPDVEEYQEDNRDYYYNQPNGQYYNRQQYQSPQYSGQQYQRQQNAGQQYQGQQYRSQ